MSDPSSYAARLRKDAVSIFLLHGVVENNDGHPVRNYTRKHLEKDFFADFLRDLTQIGAAVSMDQVLDMCGGGEMPENAFAITFDDGFENNLSVAAPMLADFDVPATFYVTSDFIENNRMSWIDRIEWAVEQTAKKQLDLPWLGRAVPTETVQEKCALLDEIRRHVKQDPAFDADGFASDVQGACGLDETWASDDVLDQKLDWAGVAALHDHALFTVGGHTHTHPILSFLNDDDLAFELDTSLDLLKRHAGVGPTHYSYPEGLAHCYSDTVIAALKNRGVRCCPTAEDGTNAMPADPFRLKRIFVV